MRKIIAFLCIGLLIVSCKNSNYENLTPIEKTKQNLIKNYALFAVSCKKLDSLIQKTSNITKAQNEFKTARLHYKKTESFISLYYPETSKSLNGAAIDKNDIHETSRKKVEATGFQKVEELLFAKEIDIENLKKHVGIFNGFTQTLKTNIENIQLSDSNIFEAQKLQMVRMMSLGISGFDSPITLHSIPEAKATIESISDVILTFTDDEKFVELISKTKTYLDKNQNFNTFDRADFIVNYCIPISNTIHKIQQKLKIKTNPYTNAINLDKQNIFEEGAFNQDYFAPNYNQKPNSAQIALGEKLFFDPILSGNNKVSCATCHIPTQAYADHKTKAVEGIKSRNTPTLLNSAFQNVQFLDGRVTYLEDQAKSVINNKDEMHGSFANALNKIKNNPTYQKKFKTVFTKEKEITEQNLLKSLASYVRSLSKLNSKFDTYLRGKTKLTASEKNGFNLYMGKAKCATCHFFPLFNGSVPPLYNETESEVLGVPSQNATQNATIDSDLGEFLITKAPLKKHAFKTPTIRNSSITFPYMHNGVYQKLEDVIDFYNRGGGHGVGIAIENQTLPTNKLNLTKSEIKNLNDFIKTLNNSGY
ncbi:cytochrome-c peroxidase [Flavobacterium sp. F372]|uniref:Cytochrome-c peroxidase n=1 Tax=Flavobacterium bernardetii TaxID=2813823 RepID=A0ABR7J220_9FLAO|nr:cytochrome c peroxidase [Flavobacterium bernardetii]MBC5836068.1 cytochrome-c peroxidase [Flavobacterium bernardetii]NHF71192.1 cytochrome-c peroxidase [Flavobacterium bernardetii]